MMWCSEATLVQTACLKVHQTTASSQLLTTRPLPSLTNDNKPRLTSLMTLSILPDIRYLHSRRHRHRQQQHQVLEDGTIITKYRLMATTHTATRLMKLFLLLQLQVTCLVYLYRAYHLISRAPLVPMSSTQTTLITPEIRTRCNELELSQMLATLPD